MTELRRGREITIEIHEEPQPPEPRQRICPFYRQLERIIEGTALPLPIEECDLSQRGLVFRTTDPGVHLEIADEAGPEPASALHVARIVLDGRRRRAIWRKT